MVFTPLSTLFEIDHAFMYFLSFKSATLDSKVSCRRTLPRKRQRIQSLSSSCKNLTFCNISLNTEDVFLKLEYVFTIQRAIHTRKGDSSRCIFFRIMPLFRLRLIILYHAPHSRGLARACGALVNDKVSYFLNFVAQLVI